MVNDVFPSLWLTCLLFALPLLLAGLKGKQASKQVKVIIHEIWFISDK